MSHVPLLDELVVIAAVGVLVAVVLARLRLPTTAGLLIAGALAGPSGLGLVRDLESIEALAEVGVVLLLFTIGLELSLERLRSIWRAIVLGGALQVGVTAALTTLVAVLASGLEPRLAIVFGLVIALSSTAIVLRALAERGELDAPHGRFIVGVLVFQDLCVVPMVLVVPLLAGSGGLIVPIAVALAKAAGVVIVVVVVARALVPRILAWVDRSRSRDVFVLAVLGLCMGTAWLTALAGLSLALGAFLGGLVVAGTVYKHRALGDILPLRDVFTSVFFVSLGMLFDVRVVGSAPLTVGALLAALVVGKGIVATGAALVMGFPARAAWLSGVGLAQFGEFGFVLATIAVDARIVRTGQMQELLAAGVLSMCLTPILMRVAPRFRAGERLLRPLERRLGARGIDEPEAEHEALRGHVVLVGFGVAGHIVARALSERGVAYIVLELNADTVRRAREEGEPVYYADASSSEALTHAGLAEARAVVLVINDPEAARRAVAAIRTIAPRIPVFLRTRYVADRASLAALGATEIVSDELEAGKEMVARIVAVVGAPAEKAGAVADTLDEP